MMTKAKLPILLLALGILPACGGGGSGSGSVTYSGVTTQASVTTANAMDLSVNAYQNGSMGTSANLAGVTSASSAGASLAAPVISGVGATLKGCVNSALQARASSGQTSLAGVAVQNTVYGAYGGSADYTLNVNQATGAFSGTFVFTSLQDAAGDPVLSGTVGVAGVYDSGSETFTSMTLTVSPLTVNDAQGSIRMYGTMTFSGGATNTFAISCLIQSSAGKVFWVKDWNFSYDASKNVTVSGTYYNPDYGYVVISTPVALSGSSASGDPTSGTLDFSGSNGSTVEIVYGSTDYTLSLHTAGNVDYVYRNGSWQLATP